MRRPFLQCSGLPQTLAACQVALLQATGADVHLALVSVLYDGDALNIGTELAVDRAERVGNRTTGNRMLAADLTNLGHDKTSNGGASAGCDLRRSTHKT